VEAALEGTCARDLNRMLLSTLRRVDRRATLHAAWTSEEITEHFFDYTARWGASGPDTGDEPRSESLMRLLRGTHGHHAASKLIMRQKTSAVRPAAIRTLNQPSLQSTSPNPYTLRLSPGASTKRCPRHPGYIAHKVHLLVRYDLEWEPLEMEDGEEIRVHTFTLDESLAATRMDYRFEPEAALGLWLYRGWMSKGNINFES